MRKVVNLALVILLMLVFLCTCCPVAYLLSIGFVAFLATDKNSVVKKVTERAMKKVVRLAVVITLCPFPHAILGALLALED